MIYNVIYICIYMYITIIYYIMIIIINILIYIYMLYNIHTHIYMYIIHLHFSKTNPSYFTKLLYIILVGIICIHLPFTIRLTHALSPRHRGLGTALGLMTLSTLVEHVPMSWGNVAMENPLEMSES